MSEKPISAFEEFWPFYLREHSRASTRALHFAGTTVTLIVIVSAIVSGQPRWILFALVPGYGLAWFSHFFIEKNRPASFKYPLWSLAADFKMWSLMLTGRIRREVERHVSAPV